MSEPRRDVIEMADKINNMNRNELIRLVAMFIGEYNQASCERDKLKADYAAKCSELDTIRNYEASTLGKAHAEIKSLREENKIMREALEHYQSAHYNALGHPCAQDKTADECLANFNKKGGER